MDSLKIEMEMLHILCKELVAFAFYNLQDNHGWPQMYT
jgi:hypothetical protein